MPIGVYKRTAYHNTINRLGHLGHKVSDKTKRKLSLSHSGSKNSFFGKRHKPKTLILLRSLKLGKSLTEEHKAKIRQNTPSGKLSPHWKGGISKTKGYHALHCRLRQYRIKAAGYITVDTIQSVYENNIKTFGTLTCVYCKHPIVFGNDTIDHKTPIIRGGTNRRNNLTIACRNCNSKKHTRTPREFSTYKRRTKWRLFPLIHQQKSRQVLHL